MELKADITGIDQLEKASKALKIEAVAQLKIALQSSANQVLRDAKDSILRGQKTGRIYKRGNITHRASAAGEAPANDEGRLAGSLSLSPVYQTASSGVAGLEIQVKAGGGEVKYATMLEHGTQRIAPRPFMFPALEKNKSFIINRLKRAIDDAINKVTK